MEKLFTQINVCCLEKEGCCLSETRSEGPFPRIMQLWAVVDGREVLNFARKITFKIDINEFTQLLMKELMFLYSVSAGI
jgi:hypothetical protein